MSATETSVESPVETRAGRPDAGKYVVLKKLSEGSWMEIDRIDAKDSNAAIRETAVGEEAVIEGTYIAVPASSFRERVVKQVVQVSLG